MSMKTITLFGIIGLLVTLLWSMELCLANSAELDEKAQKHIVTHARYSKTDIGKTFRRIEALSCGGSSLVRLEELQGLLNECRKKEELQSLADDVELTIGDYWCEKQEYHNAIQQYEKVIRDYPEATRSPGESLHFLPGMRDLQTGANSRIGILYVDRYPHLTMDSATVRIAKIYILQDNYKDALDILQTMVNRHVQKGTLSDDYTLRVPSEFEGFSLKDNRYASNLIVNRPDKKALHLIALCQVKLGNYNKAIEAYNKLLEYFPNVCFWAKHELELIKVGQYGSLLKRLEEQKETLQFDF